MSEAKARSTVESNDRVHPAIALVTPLAGASGAPSRGSAPAALAGDAGVRRAMSESIRAGAV